MTRLSERVYIHVCKFLNCNCYHCSKNITGKYCISKREEKRYCLPCAALLKIITREDCERVGVEFPLKHLVKLHQKKKLTLQALKEYGIKKSEVLLFA